MTRMNGNGHKGLDWKNFMKRIHMKKIIMMILAMGMQYSYGFDIEDYATTFRATRDAYRLASQELRFAERDLLLLLKMQRSALPMRMDTYSKMGSKVTSCSYLKECSETFSRTKALALFDSVTQNKVKLKTFIAAGLIVPPDNITDVEDLRADMVTYYDNLNTTITTDQKVLFEQTAETILFDQDAYNDIRGQNNTYADPFGYNTSNIMADYAAARASYLLKLKEAKLARTSYLAAKAGYAAGVQGYYNNSACSGFMNNLISIEDWLATGAIAN